MRGLNFLFQVALGAVLIATMPASAQVRCTMPNGVVIEQRLSDACPQGAVKSETLEGAPAPVREQPLAQAQPVRSGPDGRAVQTVSASEFGPAWPLTVQSGDLRCVLPDSSRTDVQALIFMNAGQAYALNGTARSHAGRMGWSELGALWRDSPASDGTKVSIAPLIERAQRLCAVAPSPGVVAPAEKTAAMPVAVQSETAGGFPLIYILVVLGGLGALVMAMKGSAGTSGPAMYCTTCGHEGPGKSITRGSLAIEIILWLFFLVPGLLYSIWRLSSKYKGCASCGARTLVPPASPIAVATKKRVAG